MKRLVFIIVIVGLIFIIYRFINKANTTTISSNEVKIGVVETTSSDYNSRIQWYDKDLNIISVQRLKYAMLGSTFHNPVYYNDEVFLIPQGLGDRKDSKKVISINSEDLTIKEYPFNNIALNDLAVSQDYVYTVNTLNGDTYISRLDKSDNVIKEIIVNKEYISGITAIRGRIYAFSSNMLTSSPKFNLYVYNEELELLNKKDITEYGTGQYKFMYDEEFLYANVMSTKEDNPSTMILKISTVTNEIETIDLKEEFPNDILQYKDKIIITNHDPVVNEGSKIRILDKKTEEIESIELDRKTEFAGIMDDFLVIANQEYISLYDIKNKFKLAKEISIEKNDDSYISNIIIFE